jgi:hypothetical protein
LKQIKSENLSSSFNQWQFHEILKISRTETGKSIASFTKMTWAIGIRENDMADQPVHT